MIRRATPLLAAAFLAGCGDLLLETERVPTRLELSSSTVTVTEGRPVPLTVTVLDQDGQPFGPVPEWAAPAWSFSAPQVAVRDGGLVAVEPGAAEATVQVAGLSASATVRVNPAEIAVSIDSVDLAQNGTTADVLAAGQDATVRVFLTTDKPNFFQPVVRVNVRRDGALVQSIDAPARTESIPQRIDASAAWVVTVPGSLIRQGHALEILADPGRTLPHAAGSRTRYPESGEMALRFALTIRVHGAYLTQSIQRSDGSVPLVAGRNALLRVFATSDEDIAVKPTIRATLYRDGAAVATYDMQRQEASFPRTVDEGSILSSWNAAVPGSVLTPGVHLVVEADPDGTIPRTAQSSARYPASGTLSLDVRTVPKFWMRVVPIRQTQYGTTGNVHAGNLPHFVRDLQAMFPIAEHDIDLRTPYSTSATASDGEGWRAILSEIWALRAADGSRRYYYGVLEAPSGSGIAGLGYVGYPASVGYDRLPGAAGTLAHELGHNFGMWHTPCGGPSSVDPDFPYSDGGIGGFGYDLLAGVLKDPATERDLMSYCRPRWTSDYTYRKALGFRTGTDGYTGPDVVVGDAEEPVLLVWGRVDGSSAVLEPAFELTTRPALPARPGPYTIEGVDAAGTVLFSLPFRGAQLAELRTTERQFAFTIPARLARTDRLAGLRLTGPGLRVERRPAAAATRPTAPDAALRRAAPGEVRIEWEAPEAPMALVRDPRTGEILSFARGGAASLRTDAPELEVLFSDGVRTTRRTLRIR